MQEQKQRKFQIDMQDYQQKVAFTNRNEERSRLQKQIRDFIKRYMEEKRRFKKLLGIFYVAKALRSL